MVLQTAPRLTRHPPRTTLSPEPPHIRPARQLLAMLESKKASDTLSLGVRPEGILVSHDDQPGYRPAEAHLIQPFGGFDIVDLRLGEQTLRARTTAGYVRKAGDRVFARIDPAQAHGVLSGGGIGMAGCGA